MEGRRESCRLVGRKDSVRGKTDYGTRGPQRGSNDRSARAQGDGGGRGTEDVSPCRVSSLDLSDKRSKEVSVREGPWYRPHLSIGKETYKHVYILDYTS